MRSTYVHSCVVAEGARFAAQRRRRRAYRLNGKQLSDADVPFLVKTLAAPPVSFHLAALKLEGNLLTEGGIDSLLRDFVCTPSAGRLRELSLSHNPGLGAGCGPMQALARLLPSAALEVLRLAGCGISAAAACCLVPALPQSASLCHLDLCDNDLDDDSVEQLLAACRSSASHNLLRVSLAIEGNPQVSAAVFQEAAVLAGLFA